LRKPSQVKKKAAPTWRGRDIKKEKEEVAEGEGEGYCRE